MDNRIVNTAKKEKTVIRKVLLYILGLTIFLVVVALYYSMLYTQTKENIINAGKINSIESAEQISEYMASSVDILKLASYTLDNMIRDGRTNSEILDYLENETIAVRDSLIEDTTGIYGYINGEYMDGSGWVPDGDYVPTERPWYIQAKAGFGRITIVDPYVDLDTGEITIAIVKTLCDTKSVVGIDLMINELQVIAEEHVRNKSSYEEFVINNRGTIIIHSNRELIGTNFSEDPDTIDRLIAKRIYSMDSGSFYMRYADHNYMVYLLPIDNDWSYISVIDATADFDKLRLPLMLTVLFACIIMGVVIFFAVLSDRRSRLARELEIKTELATAASEAKSTFLSNMSHEIRTPINAVLGMNEMILREAKNENIINYAENIKTAGATLLGIINDILDFSKIEAGKIEIIDAEYDLSSVVNDLVNMIKKRADDKGLELKLDIDRETPKMLYGDEVRIKQVITNILTNAVKYTDKGSVTLSMKHDYLTSEKEYVLLRFAISDTGKGIKPEDMSKLFAEFERIDEKRNRNIEGTGLGMSITKSLLQLMGSELKVESTYGEGSKFSFVLKQKVIGTEELGDYEASFKEHIKHRKVYKQRFVAPSADILVVDDTPMNLTVFKALVKESQIKIDTAPDGDKGLVLAAKKKYDLIFLDHMMVGKDGIETLHDLKADKDNPNLNTPTVCLTANAISGAREVYINAGFDDYLTKPIEPEALEKMLLHYLPGDKVVMTEQLS